MNHQSPTGRCAVLRPYDTKELPRRLKKVLPGSTPDSSTLHKHITVPQLLELADPPMKLEDVAKTGCIIAT